MKKRQLLFCFLLTFMLVGILSGCVQKQTVQPVESSETVQTESAGGKTVSEEDLIIASNGESDYIIWYESNMGTSKRLMELITKIHEVIELKTGAEVAWFPDSQYDEKYADRPAILVGKTIFEESKELERYDVKIKDYYVGTSGNNIMIYGFDENTCKKALDYFVTDVLENQEAADKTLIFSGEHKCLERRGYGINSITCMGTELSHYQIVVPENSATNEMIFAKLLRYYLMEKYGFCLELVQDKEETYEYKILIGNAGVSDTTQQSGEFMVSANEKKLQLAASDMQGYAALYDYVTEILIPGGSDEDYTISEGLQEIGNFMQTLEDGTLFASQNNGDVRFISYNIYGWKQAGPREPRVQMQIELVKTYQPDVLAFQEFSEPYHKLIAPMLTEQGYEEVQVVSKDVINYTPLFYRTDRLNVLDGGYFLFSGVNDMNTKSVTWGVFEVIETGKKFVSMSAHFLHSPTGIDAISTRNSNATEVVALVEEIYANPEYKDLPLLLGGDLNSTVTSQCQEILKDSGLENAWDVAEVKNDAKGHYKLPTYNEVCDTFLVENTDFKGTQGSAIDHVYVSENIIVKDFATLMDMYTSMSSDHRPKLVDFTLD